MAKRQFISANSAVVFTCLTGLLLTTFRPKLLIVALT